jgi:phage/plasmid-associated DNA primase
MGHLSSPVQAFVDEWCVVEKDASIPVKELFVAYKFWADGTGLPAMARHMFGKELRDVVSFLRMVKREGQRTYIGVGLTEEGETKVEKLRGTRATKS